MMANDHARTTVARRPADATRTRLETLSARLDLLELALAGHEALRACEVSAGLFRAVHDLQASVAEELARWPAKPTRSIRTSNGPPATLDGDKP